MQLTDGECNALRAVISTLQIAESTAQNIIEASKDNIVNKCANASDEVEDLLEDYTDASNALCNIQKNIEIVQSRYQSVCVNWSKQQNVHEQ